MKYCNFFVWKRKKERILANAEQCSKSTLRCAYITKTWSARDKGILDRRSYFKEEIDNVTHSRMLRKFLQIATICITFNSQCNFYRLCISLRRARNRRGANDANSWKNRWRGRKKLLKKFRDKLTIGKIRRIVCQITMLMWIRNNNVS